MIIEDAFLFAQGCESLCGEVDLGQLPRVRDEITQAELDSLPDMPAPNTMTWQLSPAGQTVPGLQPNRVILTVSASPVLICQRCMQPFVFPVTSTQTLEIVRRQPDQVSLDESGFVETDECDKVLAQPSLDVGELIEDELLLSLPYIPRHDVCPDGSSVDTPREEAPAKPSPFAVLQTLKDQD